MKLKIEVTHLNVKDLEDVKLILSQYDKIESNKIVQLEKYGNSFIKMTDPTKRMFVTLTQDLGEPDGQF